MSLAEGSLAIEPSGRAEFFLDAQELIVFCDAISARGRTRFNLASAGGNGEVGDKRVFSFAGAMRDNRVVAGFARHFDRVDGFGHAANLIELDEDGIGNSLFDAAR